MISFATSVLRGPSAYYWESSTEESLWRVSSLLDHPVSPRYLDIFAGRDVYTPQPRLARPHEHNQQETQEQFRHAETTLN